MPFFDTSRLHDKVVLITGASAGIGRASAVLFSRLGANVVITARRLEVLNEVASECTQANKEGGSGKGGKVHVAKLDMQDKDFDKFAQELPEWAKGKVDIFVSNAGLALGRAQVGEIDPQDVDTMFNTNVLGLIKLTQVFVKDMKARGSGHIIQIGSIAGRESYAGGSIYSATKFAVHSFTNALMKELVDTNIRVSEVQPGMVETDFSITRNRGDKEAAKKVYEGLTPLTGQDIAEEVCWIASRPERCNVAEVLILPTCQASTTISHRKS